MIRGGTLGWYADRLLMDITDLVEIQLKASEKFKVYMQAVRLTSGTTIPKRTDR